MRRLTAIIAALLAVIAASLVVSSWIVSQPAFDETLRIDPSSELEIAPLTSALTFARTNTDGVTRTLLVAAATVHHLEMIDLEVVFGQPIPDPIDAVAELGLPRLIEAAATEDTVRITWDNLTLPFDPAYPHLAAGTNFSAHAQEVGLDDEPFLFPKLTHPTPWNSEVPARTRLDFEAELCAVTLSPYRVDQAADLGYVLCNDFTDRWTLVRDLDFDTPMGTTGFPDAKGRPGMLPIGPFLVVPIEDNDFYADLELELYSNGDLRQRARAGLMIWSPHDIATRALERCTPEFQTKDTQVALTDCTALPRGTLILTGTPAGVLFHVLSIWRPGAYLQAGDEVVTLGQYLGVLRNRVQ